MAAMVAIPHEVHHPSTRLHFLTTATGGVLAEVRAREVAMQKADMCWRLVQPTEDKNKTISLSGQLAFGERRPSDKASQLRRETWKGTAGGKVDMDLGKGVTETIEIDAVRGPKVLTKDGGFIFSVDAGLHSISWTKLSVADQKVVALQVAQKNVKMRPIAAEYLAHMQKVEETRVFLALDEDERRKQRCEAEQARSPVQWTTMTMDMVQKNHNKIAKGMLYGLEFPWSAQTLVDFGPEWLTQAFHAAGTLEKTNAVTEIIIEDKIKIDAGNNAGKFLFEVRYKTPRKDLHEKLFAKCPFQMTRETSSDRISSSVLKQPMDLYEINTYRLIEAFFPVKTPKFYYGDISNTTSNFILITERILYTGYDGVNHDKPLKPFEVEGPYDKCKDWQLRSPAKEYYMLLVKTHAQIAGLDKAGKLASERVKKTGLSSGILMKTDGASGMVLDACSGPDPKNTLQKLITAIKFFTETAKAIFPEYVTTEAFKTKFKDSMMTANAYQREIVYFKDAYAPEYTALGHLNLNADNAYFWRNESGEMECGLIDWGGFGQGNLGHKVWWTFNCADYENFAGNLGEYIDMFIDTYQEYGGPVLDKKVFLTMIYLTMFENAHFMVSAVPNCFKMCKEEEWKTIKDCHDPRIASNVDGKSTLRTTLKVLDNCLRVIEEMRADEALQRWIQDTYVGKMRKPAKTTEMIYG